MAQATAVAPKTAPDTLPPDFNQWDAPDTLPADYFDKAGYSHTTGPPPKQPGMIESIQNGFDDAVTPRMATPGETTGQRVLRGSDNVERGMVSAVGGPFVHPLNTLKSVWDTSIPGSTINAGIDLAHGRKPTNPMQPLVDSLKEHPEEGAESLAGNVLGGVALGGITDAAGSALAATGRGGLDLGNAVLGARGPKPFKYGANPARGAYEEGVLPAMSRHSASMKMEPALDRAGGKVSDAVMNSGGTVPQSKIASSIEKPVMDAGNVMSGFGGGKPLDPVANVWASMEEKAPNAATPIYGKNAPQNVPAPDLWHSIRNLDKNTRFNPDPEVEGVNELRRDIRGGLRGNLEEAVPGLKPLTQRYQDLASGDESLGRVLHSGTNLRKMLDIPATAVESTVGRGMYEASKAAPFVHGMAPAGRVAALVQSLRDQKKKEQ